MRHMKHREKERRVPNIMKSKTATKIDPYRYRCPKCGACMEYLPAYKVYGNGTSMEMMLICKRDDIYCKTWRSSNGNVFLSSTPADSRLRALRQETHYYFDKLYTMGVLPGRDAAYQWLTMNLGYMMLDSSTCRHIGEFNEGFCRKTIEMAVDLLHRNRDRLTQTIYLYTNDKGSYSRENADIRRKLWEINEAVSHREKAMV